MEEDLAREEMLKGRDVRNRRRRRIERVDFTLQLSGEGHVKADVLSCAAAVTDRAWLEAGLWNDPFASTTAEAPETRRALDSV
jgi:hypothetical protein